MAQQATLKKTAEVSESVSKIGRPPGARDLKPRAKPASKGKVFDYSRFKLTFQKPEDFYAYLQGYPDKTGLMGYVHRLKPRIDLSLIGIDETHIQRTTVEHEMTEEFIGNEFGRGLYMVILNDANRPKGQTELCRTWFDCSQVPKPPKYDVRTLCLGEQKNQDEIARLLNAGVLVRDTPISPPRLRTQADGVAPPPSAPDHNGGGELLSKDVVGQMLIKLIDKGSQSPAEMMRQSIDIAKLLSPPAAPSLNVEQIAELVAAKMGRPANGLDPFASYDRIQGFIQQHVQPAVASGGEDTTLQSIERIVVSLINGAPVIFDRIERMRERRTSVTNNGNAVQNVPVAPPLKPLPDRIAEIATIGYQKMTEGVRGLHFAAWVCNWYEGGLEVYRFLEPRGTAGVVGLAAMNPQTAPLFANPATQDKLVAFLDDFFIYDPEGAQDEEEPAAESTSAAA